MRDKMSARFTHEHLPQIRQFTVEALVNDGQLDGATASNLPRRRRSSQTNSRRSPSLHKAKATGTRLGKIVTFSSRSSDRSSLKSARVRRLARSIIVYP